MKGLFSKLLSFIALVFLTSCGTAVYYQGFTISDTSDGIALLSPVSCIYYLDNTGKESFDDSLSLVSEFMMTELVSGLGLPITSSLPLDSLQREESIAFMRYALSNKPVILTEAPIPHVLDSLLETNSQRYGILLYTEGMTRDRKQYVKDVVASAAFGVLMAVATMGAYYGYGYAMLYAAQVNVAVLDSDYNRVVFYNRIPTEEANPMSEKHMGKFVARLFKDFKK